MRNNSVRLDSVPSPNSPAPKMRLRQQNPDNAQGTHGTIYRKANGDVQAIGSGKASIREYAAENFRDVLVH